MFDLTGKTALITGAASGFGAHFAEVLAAHGAALVLVGRRLEALERTAEYVRSVSRAAVHCRSVDICNARAVADTWAGMHDIDILINNAGVTRTAPALEQSEEEWDAVVNTDLKGAYLMARQAAASMRAAGRPGSIVNVASILGLRQAGNVAPYAISKAGLVQMTKVLALEWARFGIRVNALAPGYFNTDLNSQFLASEAGQALIRRVPQRRAGTLTDLDGPLLLLVSDASSYMTGSVIAVDGGHLVSTL
jgi:NAD(P)-dependent dehydrogenase (short-subunit alcohol dehydrogenase family)